MRSFHSLIQFAANKRLHGEYMKQNRTVIWTTNTSSKCAVYQLGIILFWTLFSVISDLFSLRFRFCPVHTFGIRFLNNLVPHGRYHLFGCLFKFCVWVEHYPRARVDASYVIDCIFCYCFARDNLISIGEYVMNTVP